MKRRFSLLLAFAIILTIVPRISIAQGSLLITSPKTINVKSGDSLKIPITIENFHDYDIENIRVMAEISDPSYIYLSDSSSKYIEYIEAEDKEKVSFELEIDKTAPRGTYKVDITLMYEGLLQKETVYIRVTSKSAGLDISKLDFLPSKVLTPGQQFNISIHFENQGEVLAENISIALEGLSGDGIFLVNGSSTQRLKSIPSGGKGYAVYQLKTSDSLKQGSHPLKLKIKYNGDIEETRDIIVNVQRDIVGKSNLVFENLTFPKGSIGQNKEVTISFNLRNQGQTYAKNVQIKANSMEIDGLVPTSVSQQEIEKLMPGQSIPVDFKFLTTHSSQTKSYPVEISVEYKDETTLDDEKYGMNQLVGIFVTAPEEKDEDANQSTPKLIIDKYSFEPSLVQAGENFTMNLSFYNTNSLKSVKNIKIFLTSDERTDPDSNSAGGSVFTPVNSSNTFYIDSIPPKGRVEKKITMFTVPDAQAKTYTLTANFEYEDSEANPYTATELIGVPVVQQSKLDIGEISVFPEAYVDQSTPISLEFYNTGKVSLYNMMVKLEGDFQSENGQYYVGNFDSGSSEYFEGYVIPSAPGPLTGEVVFTYEDSTGQNQEIRKEFSLNVMEMMEPEFPGEYPEDMPDDGGPSTPMIVGGIVGAIALVVAIVLYKRRKKNQLKALEIDE